MTFLELCQKTGTDSGLISYQNIPTTVTGATGRWAGHRQLHRAGLVRHSAKRGPTGSFLRASFSHALVIGQASYTPVELGIAERFARFAVDAPAAGYQPMHCYDPAIGLADDASLYQISPECWSMIYGRGPQTPTKPTEYALANGKLYVGSKPDKAYVLAATTWKAPQILVADSDVPDLPDHFHDIIAWKAIMKISGKDGAFADRLVAQGEYSTMYRQLVAEQTRPITLADSLA
jgi:hypothetical protein